MLRFVPKSVKYYASAATALWGARAAIGLEIGLTATGVACLVLLPIVFAYVRIEEHYRDNEDQPKKTKDDYIGGFMLSLAESLKLARFADPDDEAIAEQANKLVRKELDKRCISYRKYKEIRRKNPSVFTAVVSENNDLIGFFDIFPLTEKAASAVLNGKKRDADIGIDDIVPNSENAHVTHLYVATILYNADQNACPATIGREIVSLKLYEFLLTQFAPIKRRTLLAYAHTKAGQRLLEKARFKVRLTAKDTVQRRPLFVLEASRADEVRDRYEGICAALAALEGRRSRGAPAVQDLHA